MIFKTLKPNPNVTSDVTDKLAASVNYIRQNPETITQALRDSGCRKEFVGLVDDLVSLLEVIDSEAKNDDTRRAANTKGAQ